MEVKVFDEIMPAVLVTKKENPKVVVIVTIYFWKVVNFQVVKQGNKVDFIKPVFKELEVI